MQVILSSMASLFLRATSGIFHRKEPLWVLANDAWSCISNSSAWHFWAVVCFASSSKLFSSCPSLPSTFSKWLGMLMGRCPSRVTRRWACSSKWFCSCFWVSCNSRIVSLPSAMSPSACFRAAFLPSISRLATFCWSASTWKCEVSLSACFIPVSITSM